MIMAWGRPPIPLSISHPRSICSRFSQQNPIRKLSICPQISLHPSPSRRICKGGGQSVKYSKYRLVQQIEIICTNFPPNGALLLTRCAKFIETQSQLQYHPMVQKGATRFLGARRVHYGKGL